MCMSAEPAVAGGVVRVLVAVGCAVVGVCSRGGGAADTPTPTPLPPAGDTAPPGVLSGEGASWARLDGVGMAAGGGVSSADGIGCVGLADGTPGRPLRGGPSKGVGLADPLRAVRLGPVPSVLLRLWLP